MKKIIIFLPGNPSIPGVYKEFLASAKDKIGASEVFDLFHLGQNSEVNTYGQDIHLNGVIEDHKNSIEKILINHPQDEVILIAHSLGGTVASQLYQNFKNQISKVVFLMPLLYLEGKNRVLIKLLSKKIINKVAFSLCHYMVNNPTFSQLLFTKIGGQKADLVKYYLSNEKYLCNFTRLIESYFDAFKDQNFLMNVLEIPSEKALFIFTQGDFWSPPSMAKKLNHKFKVIIDDEISHDFCLDTKDTEKILGYL